MYLQVPADNTLPPCPYTQGSLELGDHREGEGRAPHLCAAFVAHHFTTSLLQAAAQGGAEHCCFEFLPGEICDLWVVQIEASEELREVLVRPVSIRRDIP